MNDTVTERNKLRLGFLKKFQLEINRDPNFSEIFDP